jgi:hypothetical protein
MIDMLFNTLKNSANSVILYDKKGRRQIYCDLKELQDTNILWNI